MKWIEVKARISRQGAGGAVKTVRAVYMADAMTCAEAEARVIEHLTAYVPAGGTLSVTATAKTKIDEVMRAEPDAPGGSWYRVKLSLISADARTGKLKRAAVLQLVEGAGFEDALSRFRKGMRGTVADYEIESIAATAYQDVFAHETA
ncbi:MAG: DUF4494 domain-containing protein [Muribaculaceae bacterium]|nr:DUF4494 domain-containing protein [Muribaculaceae bacterium]